MQQILHRQIIGGEYLKWIVILQEFELEFVSSNSKKYLAFVELMSDLHRFDEEPVVNDSLFDEFLFLIESSNIWYISKPDAFILGYPMMRINAYVIRINTTLSLMKLFIVEDFI
jgi:hypothetical protein